MKTWAVQLKTEKEIFLKTKQYGVFKKTLTPQLMTFKEAKEQAEWYKILGLNTQPFDTENSITKIERLYNGTL